MLVKVYSMQLVHSLSFGWILLSKVMNNLIILLHITGHWLPLPTYKMEPRHGIMKAFPKVKRVRVLQGKDDPPLKKKPLECDITGCYFMCVQYAKVETRRCICSL